MIVTPCRVRIKFEHNGEVLTNNTPPELLEEGDTVLGLVDGGIPCECCGAEEACAYDIGHGHVEDHSYVMKVLCKKCAREMREQSAEYWVEVYEDDRAFGGHEEGGWWYDVSDRIISVPVSTLSLARELLADLKSRYTNERYDIDSILCAGIYRHVISPEQGPEHEPEKRPFYE